MLLLLWLITVKIIVISGIFSRVAAWKWRDASVKEKVAVAQNVSKLLSLKNAITSLDIDIIS